MANVKESDPIFVLLTIFVAAAFGFTLFVNALAGQGPTAPLPWFPASIGNVSDDLTTQITPADYTFAIWGLIYLWQGGWISYVLSMICRTNRDGDPLYVFPPVVTTSLLSYYLLNLVLNCLWCFAFCYKFLLAQMVVLILVAFTLYLCIADVSNRLVEYSKDLKVFYTLHWVVLIIMVQNGIALYAAWVTVASMIGVNIFLIYALGVSLNLAATVSLIVLNGLIVIYFLLENVTYETTLKTVYSPWVVFIWALIGSIVANWDPANINSLLTAFLLSFCVLALVVKVGLGLFRKIINPKPDVDDGLKKQLVA